MFIKDIKRSRYFKAIDETVLCELIHPKNDGVKMDFSIAHAVLKPGTSSLPHTLTGCIEVYYIIGGIGEMYIDLEKKIVESGQAVYIPSNTRQWIKNIGNDDLMFLCIVSPPWGSDEEKLCQ